MNRALLVACTLLSALCILQWVTLRRLKADLAVVNYAMAASEFADRREEIERVIGWLDADARAAGTGGAQSSSLVCLSEPPNPAAARDMLFDMYVYLRSRAAGVSEAEARQRVADSRDQRAHAR